MWCDSEMSGCAYVEGVLYGSLRFSGLNRFVFFLVTAGQGASDSWRVLLVEATKASQVI